MTYWSPVTSVDLSPDSMNIPLEHLLFDSLDASLYESFDQQPSLYSSNGSLKSSGLGGSNSEFAIHDFLPPLFDFDFSSDFQLFPEDSNTNTDNFEYDWNYHPSPGNPSITSPDNFNGFDSFDSINQSPVTLDNVKSFRCEYCSQTFAQEGRLTRHIRKHTKPFKCNTERCNKAFAERRDLNRHARSCRHSPAPNGDNNGNTTGRQDDKRPKCQICGKALSRSDSVQRHMRDRHRDRSGARKRTTPLVMLLPKPDSLSSKPRE